MLQNADRVVVVNLLKSFEQSMRQELLDELAGAKRANALKGNGPPGCVVWCAALTVVHLHQTMRFIFGGIVSIA